jgi:hypothetical protein
MAANKGIAETVRRAAKRLGKFTAKDLYDADCDLHFPKSKITIALRDFCSSGEIRRIESGEKGKATVYEYIREKTLGFGVREKVCRAMHVKGRFTVRDVAVLSDADRSYVYLLVRKLQDAGAIRADGKTEGPRKNEQAFLVKNRDEFFLKWVRGSQKSVEAESPWRRKTKG